MKKEDFNIHNFSNIQNMIIFIEQKANILLVIYGIILSKFISIINNLIFVKLSDSSIITIKSLLIFLFSSALFTLLSIQIYVLIFKILSPRIAKHYSNGARSLFYYKHISSLDKTVFIEKIKGCNEDDLDNEVVAQVYEISKIATAKQKYYNKLAKMLFVTFIILSSLILTIKL